MGRREDTPAGSLSNWGNNRLCHPLLPHPVSQLVATPGSRHNTRLQVQRHVPPAPDPSPDLCPAPPQLPPPPVTPWWRSISAGAWARTTRSLSRLPTQCPSQALWTTTLPKPWEIRGFRSRRPRMARPAARSRPRAGASPPVPLPTWSATVTPPLWSPEESTVLQQDVHLHGLPEL